jgi:hypothetical protein
MGTAVVMGTGYSFLYAPATYYCGIGAPIGAIATAFIYSNVEREMPVFAAALEGRAVQQRGRRGWADEGQLG